MQKLEVCKECEYNDSFYGCMNQNCEVYIEVKAEADFEHMRDKEDKNERY